MSGRAGLRALLSLALIAGGTVLIAGPSSAGKTPKAFTISVDSTTVDEDDGSFDVTIERTPTKGKASITVGTTGGTADGNDLLLSNGRVTLPAGQGSTTLTFQITDDVPLEVPETFTVTASNASKGWSVPSDINMTLNDTSAYLFTVEPGETITVDNISFSGCNTLLGTLTSDTPGAASGLGGNSGQECGSPVPGVDYSWDNEGTSDAHFNLELQDLYCFGMVYTAVGEAYFGSSPHYYNHATLTADSPVAGTDHVDIADGGFECEFGFSNHSPSANDGNFQANVTITTTPTP